MPPQETKTRTREEIINLLLDNARIDIEKNWGEEKKLYIQLLNEYAQARFDASMVEEVDESHKKGGCKCDERYEIGYTDCRSEIIRRFNSNEK